MDQTTRVAELKELVEEFVSEREWAKFHNPKSLSMAVAVEAAELMDLFKWHASEDSVELLKDADTMQAIREEIADIIILCLAFANRGGIDLASAVREKIKKNRRKYPLTRFKGRF